jgi:hypothetical protein
MITARSAVRSAATAHVLEHQLLAQQSTKARQMRWTSIVRWSSITWLTLGCGGVNWERISRGAIQRSDIGSYHFPK